MNTDQWRKSSYSGPEQGNCLEWEPEYAAAEGTVPVRDSKMTGGQVLMVSTEAWSAFVGFARTEV
ncbi:DUF397 domain-containing protein [Streptomyces lasiicapitis]|uniref:DUF397 domain-containing protein n=1 Tax=Streptomyces lasiicapitis TaxID=1923961 RepID=UPI00364DFE2B